MKKVNRQTIIFPLIFLFLTYCLLGCGKEEVSVSSTTKKNVTSINKAVKIDGEIKRIKEILVSNPNNYEAHYSLGTLYEEKFMLDNAFNAYKKAALLNPSSEDPLIGQGRILNKKSNYYEAVSMLEKAFRNNQDKMEIYYYLGLAYAKTGNPDNAIVLWQGAIDKSRDKSNTYYLKGLIQKQKCNFEAAETLLKNAITRNPEFAAAHMVLEALYSSEGRYGDAYRHAEIHRKTKQRLQSNDSEKQVTSVSENEISSDETSASTKISQKDTAESVAGQAKTFTIGGINDAINYSGKTRMLSMKMAKLYGIQVLKDYPVDKKQNAKKDLNDTIKIANNTYMALLAFPPASANSEVNKAIKESQAYWYQMEKVLSKEPTKEVFSEVLDMSDNMLEKNNTMTKYLESLAPYAQSELIDIAGRQRMNSMKLARDYLAASMDIDKKHRMDSMLESASLFDSAMLTLEGASGNTSEIKGLIKSITKMEWRKVNQTVNKCFEDKGAEFNVLIMINFCEKLLIKTDRLTRLYVGISSGGSGT